MNSLVLAESPKENILTDARFGACICCHDDSTFLGDVIRAFDQIRVIVVVSKVAWDGTRGDWQRTVEVARANGAEVQIGEFGTESDHRKWALSFCRELGIEWLFVLDSDEIIEPKLRDRLTVLASTGVFDLFRCRMATYWKSTEYRIFPPEELAPVVLVNAQTTKHEHIREYTGLTPITLGFEHGVLHHLSYAGSDERIFRKITTWSHKHELVSAWYERTWLGWDRDRTMRDLHPTHPHCYGYAERIPIPVILSGVENPRQAVKEPTIPTHWPSVSVVIPLYGGPDDIKACLESLAICGIKNSEQKESKRRPSRADVTGKPVDNSSNLSLLSEVIVVDDFSPDNAAEVAAAYPFVKLLRNEENLGFGESCNKGARESKGEVVLFLNSDTRVPRSGLIRLIETLMSSGTVGASGPLSNHAGYQQGIHASFNEIANLELFARDFSEREVQDEDVSMLVGFCLAVRRSVLNEVGVFDPRYGQGLFEDTDLIYRILRAGYRARLSRRSFVHHEGSKSLARVAEHPSTMLGRNRQKYRTKWALDLETGYASHLAGDRSTKILFNADREPSIVLENIRRLAREADVSVCIIAKNEERVIGDCLGSLMNIFPQVVLVDTGSTDKTAEIAKSHGAEVHLSTWKDSFSTARNESISHARGKWILWIDADDTVSLATIETVIAAALHAPANVNGFVIPVQFVEAMPGAGTRVDHIKLFRRDPRHKFEGRIHEQILGSLRSTGGEVQRIAASVLHSGYDTSSEGQRRKRSRDRHLLWLDLLDRPNHPFCLFNFGMTAYFSRRFAVAIGWFRRCLKHSQAAESHVRKAFSLYGSALRDLGRLEAAVSIFELGLNTVGEDPEIRFSLGMVLSQLGRLAEAREQYLAIQPDTSGFFSSLDVGILSFTRLNNLAHVCIAMGLTEEAKHHLRQAIQANPAFAGSAQALYEAAIQSGDITCAREAATAYLAAEGPTDSWATMRCGIAELGGLDPDFELSHLIHENPQTMGPGLVLVRRLLSGGRELEALPILKHLEGLGSAEAAHYLGTMSLNRGNLDEAKRHTQLALHLNSGNALSAKQLEKIELAIDDLTPLPFPQIEEDGDVLAGPFIGSLGSASTQRSIVIVTFNSASFIGECLRRVLQAGGESDEVIVVDNNSGDTTCEVVEQFSDSRIKLIRESTNLGYSRAANIGILASSGDLIALLNPDAYVENGWFDGLASVLSNQVALVGPVSDAIAGEQFVGHWIGDGSLASVDIKQLPAKYASFSKSTNLLMGVCLVIRRGLLDKHGLLCEETALGADDLEFSWRFRQLGYELRIAPSVFVHHVGGASFATVPTIETRKRIRRSDRALIRRMRAYYGDGDFPNSRDLFGCDIFSEALESAPAE